MGRRGAPIEAPLSFRENLETVAAAEILVPLSAAKAIVSAGARLLRFRFVHGQGTAVHLRSV